MRSIDEIRDIVREAMHTQDWITGTLSGGIDPPRTIKSIDVTVNGEDKLIATVKWKYPETCGLSDVRYHVTNSGNVYETVFVYKDNVLTREGGELFVTDGFKDDSLDRAIARFYDRTGLAGHVA